MTEALAQQVADVVAQSVRDAVGIELQLESQEPLLSSGVLDSISLVGLIERLGQIFAIEVDPLDVTLENFDTLSRIERYVRERRGDE